MQAIAARAVRRERSTPSSRPGARKAQAVSNTRDLNDEGRQRLWKSLRECSPLAESSDGRDELWLAVRAAVCTRGSAGVTPMGSDTRVLVSAEHATDELIAAMSWLMTNEGRARAMSPLDLFICLRGVATRSAQGSGRKAQADTLHGMTHVPPGSGLRWHDAPDWLAS